MPQMNEPLPQSLAALLAGLSGGGMPDSQSMPPGMPPMGGPPMPLEALTPQQGMSPMMGMPQPAPQGWQPFIGWMPQQQQPMQAMPPMPHMMMPPPQNPLLGAISGGMPPGPPPGMY